MEASGDWGLDILEEIKGPVCAPDVRAGALDVQGLQVTAALRDMDRLGVDFVDGYLAARAGLGAMSVASFDNDFDRLGTVRLPLS